MFKNERIYVCEDIGTSRDVFCKKLVDNGATLVANAGETTTVHVFNTFGGTLFEDLSKKGLRIVGVQCINDSLKDRKPLPRTTHPVYSRVLESVNVCGSDLTDDKVRMKTFVGYMNGTWVEEVNASTNAFLVVEPGAHQYWAALEYGIPVLKPSWVLECWEQQTIAHSKPHILPTFSGCVICVTGLSTSTRNSFQKMIIASGGRYSEQLTRSCTHLLADKPRGRKYAAAQTWGIHVVTTNWLFDSINYRGCVDVSKYELNAMPSDYEDLIYGKSGGSSRYGSHYMQSPLARRSGLPSYNSLVRRSRYSGSAVPPMYPPPFSSPLPTSNNSVPRLSLPPPMHTPSQTISSRPTPSNPSITPIGTNSTRNILSYLNKSKLDQLWNEVNNTSSAGMTYGSAAYRAMYTELTDLLDMCDQIIGKFAAESGTPLPTSDANANKQTTPTTTTTTSDKPLSPTKRALKLSNTIDASTNTDHTSATHEGMDTTTSTTTTTDIPDEFDDEPTHNTVSTNNNNTTPASTTAHTQSSEEK